MNKLQIEIAVWLCVVMAVVILRFVSRTIHFGSVKGFQLEDYVMILVAVFYLTLAAFLLKYNDHTHSIKYLSLKEQARARRYGGKLIIVIEQLWCATIWGCKISLLLLFRKITSALGERKIVTAVGAYVVVSYIVMEILFFAVWCRPFNHYWSASVKTRASQCGFFLNHLIVNMVFNISSDILMLLIPLPLFARSRLPWRKKLILLCVFGLGIFTIVCAIISKVYSFQRRADRFSWLHWYVREVSTAVIVANIPHCWVLVSECLNVQPFLSNASNRLHVSLARFPLRYGIHKSPSQTFGNGDSSQQILHKGPESFEMGQLATVEADAEGNENSLTTNSDTINKPPLQIMKDVHFRVRTESILPPREGERGNDAHSQNSWSFMRQGPRTIITSRGGGW